MVLKPRRRHKYNAQPQRQDGAFFASKAEQRRYGELRLLERADEIRDVTLQPRFPLLTCNLAGMRVTVKIGKRTAEYVADFAYYDKAGKYHVEDVKGHDLPIGKLKRALVEAAYGLTVEVVR